MKNENLSSEEFTKFTSPHKKNTLYVAKTFWYPRRLTSKDSSQERFPGFILNTFSVLILKTRGNTYHSVIACIQAMILSVIELYMSLPHSFKSKSISIACYIESSQDWQSSSRCWVLVYVSYIKGKEKEEKKKKVTEANSLTLPLFFLPFLPFFFFPSAILEGTIQITFIVRLNVRICHIADEFFTSWATREVHECWNG